MSSILDGYCNCGWGGEGPCPCPRNKPFGAILQPMGQSGWRCPSCGKVHAPFVTGCDCHMRAAQP